MGRGIGVIGMKVCAQGKLLGPGKLTMDEAIGYVLSLRGVSNVIIGCQTPEEVAENARIVREFSLFVKPRMLELQERTRRQAEGFTYYKKAP